MVMDVRGEGQRQALRRVGHGLRAPALGLLCLFAACSDSSTPPPRAVVATPVDPATAGSIRVEVRYEGAVPPPAQVDMRSAAMCATAHGEPVYDQSLVVHDERLANAVVWIKDGLQSWVFAPPSTPVVLDQTGCLYTPHVAAAMVAQPVKFVNSDKEGHNVHGRPSVVSGWNFLMPRQGLEKTLSFDKAEVAIPVGCDIHPWMKAYLAIVANPYFAVSPADGTVTLAQVPPGTYVVAAWHEKLGTREQRVTLPPSGAVTVQLTYTAP